MSFYNNLHISLLEFCLNHNKKQNDDWEVAINSPFKRAEGTSSSLCPPCPQLFLYNLSRSIVFFVSWRSKDLTITKWFKTKSYYLGKPSLKKKKKCNIFFIWGCPPPPPLFCVKCNKKLIYFLSIIRAYLGHIEPIKIFYPQNHLKKYEKSAKI